MIKVLFRSEELLIAADSESAVNTTKNAVIEYLSNLTPKNGESIIILLTTSKYVEHIKVTTKTEVVVKTAKSSVVKTAEDALRIADKFGLKEWDII